MLISVALATYNPDSNFLKQQIDSLLSQTYKNIEIIISDDCSNNNAIESLNLNKYTNIKIHKNKNNLGFVRNFERVISMCSGEIIFLCDQDDVWHATKIEKHLEVYTKDKEVEFVYNKVILIDS